MVAAVVVVVVVVYSNSGVLDSGGGGGGGVLEEETRRTKDRGRLVNGEQCREPLREAAEVVVNLAPAPRRTKAGAGADGDEGR